MKIEAVTVSIDYSTWLRKCIGNKNKLDRWVVVTHETDLDTIKLCEDNDIEYVCSERVFENDALFAKGKAINDGISKLDADDWIVHLDGDILLPENFREVVENECNDKSKLYGAHRYDEKNNKMQGQRFKVLSKDKKTNEYKKIVKRLDIPIGYFQLWHSTKHKRYLENSTTGKDDDWKFAMLFKPVREDKFVSHFLRGFVNLSFKLTDISGFQGHFKKHWKGIRNL
jgi:hypothetical protein